MSSALLGLCSAELMRFIDRKHTNKDRCGQKRKKPYSIAEHQTLQDKRWQPEELLSLVSASRNILSWRLCRPGPSAADIIISCTDYIARRGMHVCDLEFDC